nr:MAG TPA: hypothetical protein [Caudoviricetes sp.]
MSTLRQGNLLIYSIFHIVIYNTFYILSNTIKSISI